MSAKTQEIILSFIIYFFVYLLMVEWLKPVIELTDTDNLNLFCYYLALSFLFYLLKLNWKYATPLKLLFICWVIVALYTDFSFLSREAFSYLWENLVVNVQAIVTQDWQKINDPFRTVLFFILLWMTTYLLNYWIRVRKNLLLFFVLTVLFITILDTFSGYNGDKSIVITLISGFIVMGLLYAQKLMSENKEEMKGTFLFASVTSLVGLLLISGVFAYTLPKAGPSWPDPVPFFTSSNPNASLGEGSNGVTRKVGYGENDEKLGGGFSSDDTPVFMANVQTEQYWKIETKDTYTSKGWIQSSIDSEMSSFNSGESIISDITPGNEDETSVASIIMLQEFPFIMQPYGIKSVDSISQAPFRMDMDPMNQKISTFIGENTVPIRNYDATFSEPVYSLKALRNATIEDVNALSSEFDRYLQLPENLPTRVRDLATSITEGNSSLYDKAISIQRYYRQNGFSYNQNFSAIPEGDTDYVDQFLFDTKVGYCDNFSTSMVVLLRSEGIPARWVKGFAPGEVVDQIDGVPVFEVTNNNAHSWVEAYFPNVGWMTFEPTIGFSNNPTVNYDIDAQSDEPEVPEASPTPTPEKPKSENEQSEISIGFTEMMKTVAKWVSERKALIIWTLVGITFFSLLAYRHRGKWLSKVLIPVYRMRKNDWNTFEKMYHQLLKELNRYGLKREQGQTLMDFAKQVDINFGDRHMRRLTSTYENGFYGNNKDDVNYALMRESWENLINQLSG